MPDEQPEKLDLTSMDIAARKRLELKQLFPEVFTEARKADGAVVEAVDFERLKTALGEFSDILERQRERYGMTWPGKNECQKIIQQPSLATLKPDRDESVNFDETENLFIEGDNLEVLKLLQKSYYGKVKMIYIDPPYNTGNDFVYPDDYSESLDTYLKYAGLADEEGKKLESKVNAKDSARFHTQWLNMMYPRLYLARNLLREDGVIFISIDDNEVSNLRKVCDDIFGEENFISKFIWKSKLGKVGTTSTISITHEYILCFAKQSSGLSFKMIKKISEGRRENLRQWGQADRREDRPSMFYPIKIDGIEVLPIKDDGTEGRWRVGQESANKLQKNGSLELVKKAGIYNVYRNFPAGVSRIPYDTLLLDEIGTSAKGSLTLKSLNLQNYFDYPKSCELLEFLIMLSTDKNDVVLDFFAGSATTAHSVLNKNLSEITNRKFIMVQLPEPCPGDSEAAKAGFKTIADIGKERIRRVIKKIESEQEGQLNLKDKPKPDLGFKVFKLARSNFKVWDSEPKDDTEAIRKQIELHIDHIDPKASQEDILYELLLKAGFPLTTKIEKWRMVGKDVFAIEGGTLLICLEKSLTPELIRAMADANPRQVICLDEGFEGNDQLKTNAVQTFKSRSQGDSEQQQIVFRTV